MHFRGIKGHQEVLTTISKPIVRNAKKLFVLMRGLFVMNKATESFVADYLYFFTAQALEFQNIR